MITVIECVIYCEVKIFDDIAHFSTPAKIYDRILIQIKIIINHICQV